MPGNHGEVLWPRLVANKILRKRIGSNNFVTDFPNNTEESLLDLQSLGQTSPSAESAIFSHHDTHRYKIFVSTWNAGGVAPNEDLDMEDWLDTSNNICDIYVLGFQEIVPLKASNVLSSENSRVSAKWNSLIRTTLNREVMKLEKQQDDAKPGKKQSIGAIKDIEMANQVNIPDQGFRCIISKQMVGILISVWVRSELRPYIRDPSVSCIGCGIMGCLGNKGSVSVRFRLHETSFCFACSHLASGGREGDERCRNADVSDILCRSSFPRGPSLDLPRKILEHDRVIFLGDLNYRISLPEATTRLLVDGKQWNKLLENDQLKMELMDGGVFEGWSEGEIKFAPTYKYYPNSKVYYGCVEGKKGEKWRAPAWCDRIIWHGEGLKQVLYARGESMLSDHRPVKAIFTADVEILRTLKGIQKFFISERFEPFDRIASKFEMSSTDNIMRKSVSSFKL